MPPLANRDRFEQEIVSDLEPVFSAQYDRAIASPSDIPYRAFQRDLRRVMAADLVKVFRAAGFGLISQLGIVITAGAFQGDAENWASDAADELSASVVSTSRDMAASALQKANGKPQAIKEALALIYLSDARLNNIAITETTRAISAGEHAVVIPFNAGMFSRRVESSGGGEGQDDEEFHHADEEREERQREAEEEEQAKGRRRVGNRRSVRAVAPEEGKRLVPIWRIDPASNVCPHCLPLDGHSRTVWGTVYPFGPPGHVNCRCHLDWVEAAEFARMAA